MLPQDAFTMRLLNEAGISPGMRVLGAGCACGILSMLIASLVDESSEVVGVDKDATRIEIAREWAKDSGSENVTFVHGELDETVPGLGQ